MERSTSDWIAARLLLVVCVVASVQNCTTALDIHRLLAQHTARNDSPLVTRWTDSRGIEREVRDMPLPDESRDEFSARHELNTAYELAKHPAR